VVRRFSMGMRATRLPRMTVVNVAAVPAPNQCQKPDRTRRGRFEWARLIRGSPGVKELEVSGEGIECTAHITLPLVRPNEDTEVVCEPVI
jgi:hypothetical protein